ncbi:superoxide dismutase family protein [Novipirellula caenicola]|uniref:Superoxide dismutase [Cu-Zn] n=1 Tax=Novipirellula caenicola TaxID=1536901 RepID=A0ABP9W0P8_9BACT
MRLRLFPVLGLSVLLLTGCNQDVDDATNQDVTPELEASSLDTRDITDADSNTTIKAMCELVPIGDSKVKGAVSFTQQGDVVQVRGEVTGLTPGKHGFHIHEHGDLSDKETGKSAGGHFNPTDQPHGKMTDQKRHVGDLGNIEANEEGIALIEIDDSVISLSGEHSIVGRALVIHAGEDKFTQPSGDAGDRVAFGKIEKQSE